MYQWHDKILEEEDDSILGRLEDARIFSVERTDKGLRIVEECDGYYGCTLSPEQAERLIQELRGLLDEEKKPDSKE